ncbi:hypothetical protein ACFOMD_02540 [Sphingoaurantiacus capsulatus]|uniref:Antitoxin FitA-like ribbon-helix-helix domain-containing protein n=1 Tax=Sphingoaurantiacus capsulatus TaxID=1771310 RepID=A0ABV7X6I1_9SPHN
MGQALIRNLEDEILNDYREAAKRNGRSLEAELREALTRNRPLAAVQRRALADEVRAMLPAKIPGAEGADIIRAFRDTHGGRWPDAAGD